MEALAENEILNNLLKELSIRDIPELVKDYLVTEILSKISDFSGEVKHFREKYNMSFVDFNKDYEAKEEDFEKYDDLMAWQFAKEGQEYWQAKLKELDSVL